ILSILYSYIHPVSIPVEDDSDIGSPGVNGPPIMPKDAYAYIMAAYEVPPSLDPTYWPRVTSAHWNFIPSPMYPEYLHRRDEILQAEGAATTAADLTHCRSPGYVPGDEDETRMGREEEEEHPAPPICPTVPPEVVERLLALTTPPPSTYSTISCSITTDNPSPPLPIPSPPPNSPTHIEITEVVYLFGRGCVLLLPPLVMRSGRVQQLVLLGRIDLP
ncbi:hypothetical protein Tco_0133321, partial [Tanacetum coccineum]